MRIIAHVIPFSLVLAVLVYLSACAPKSQEDCGYVQNVYGERISWKGKVPVVMKIHESVPPSYYDSIKQAADTWNRSMGKTVIVVDTNDIQKGPAQAFKDTKNVIYF